VAVLGEHAAYVELELNDRGFLEAVMFPKFSLNVLNVRFMFPECAMNVLKVP
jgi:hypothetical protein